MNGDSSGVVLARIEGINDGDWQRMSTLQPSEFRKEFFAGNDLLSSLGDSLTDDEIEDMRRGGHDPRKVYAAYKSAEAAEGPAVILSHTVKGWGIDSFEGRNSTHQKKKMSLEDLISYRDSLGIPIDDESLEDNPLYCPEEDSDEIEYIRTRREALGGYLPSRRSPLVDIQIPGESTFSEFDEGTREGQLVSTTMAFVRLLRKLMKSEVGPLVVPIIPDEGRTFGMDPLFSEFGIFSQFGQNYTPVDHKMLMNYKESESGQIIQEGIAEATSMATWTAAATSYSHASSPTLPFYTFYSMFGFQRTADQVWAAADSRARGFLMGATAGRTTLNGEGLQHQDGHSLLMASAVPGCRAWDPAYAYELAAIIRHGINEMWGENMDVIHYVMLYNENQQQLSKPEGADYGIIKGAYKVQESEDESPSQIRILGSGPILQYAREAATLLQSEHGVSSEVWSVTSYGELRREGLDSERHNRLNPHEQASPYVSECFGDNIPTIAVSDYIAAVPEMIQRWVGGSYTVLGTDGFGRSDTRENLRRFFEIDTESIIIASLSALERVGEMPTGTVKQTSKRMGIKLNREDKAE
jgi:pyruvate dehydrogenase E1 component